jgi:hypothetical protein
MTAIGKLLALLNLVVGLGLLTWSVDLYAHRPVWFADQADPPPGPRGYGRAVGFKQLKAEADALARRAAVAGELWGTHLRALEEREKLRADRKAGYAERLRWANKGNPNDPIDPSNPKSPGKGFYEPVINPATKLMDLTLVKGVPKGKPVTGTNGEPLPGLDGLLDSIEGDTAAALNFNKQSLEKEAEFDRLDRQVVDTEIRAIKMGVIRDSAQAEVFFLSTFEVNVFETRETVFRRERQLRARLKGLGILDP